MSVTTFTTTLAGCTPSTPTTGAVSLDGTVGSTSGGTGTGTAPTSGQILVGTTGGAYVPYSLASGAGISTTTGSGTLQINNTGLLTPVFSDATFVVENSADNTKQLLVDNSPATTGTTTTIRTTQTANTTLVLPGVSDTLVGRNTTDTLTNKTVYATTATIFTTGTTQATAVPLTAQFNLCTYSVPPLQFGAVILPTPAAAGMYITIYNGNAAAPLTALNIYPAVGGQIESYGVNAAYFVLNQGNVTLVSGSATQWYVVNPLLQCLNSSWLTVTRSNGVINLGVSSTFLAPGTIQDSSGMCYSTNIGLAATGTTQATAAVLHHSLNTVTIVPAGSGVALSGSFPPLGLIVSVKNSSASPLLVYPNTGYQIDGLGVNNPVTLNAGSSALYQFASSNVWWTMSSRDTSIPSANVTAAGTNQATGTQLVADYNYCTVPSGSARAVVLPTPTVGRVITVYNSTNNPIFSLGLFPAVGGQIESLGVNQQMFVYLLQTVTLVASSTTQWNVVSSTALTQGNGIALTSANGINTVSIPTSFVAPGTIQDTSGMIYSTAGVNAAGTTQATATVLNRSLNTINSVPAGSGVVLSGSFPTYGLIVSVKNNGANPLLVYPPSSYQIESGGVNNPVTLNVGASATYQCGITNKWWIMSGRDTSVGVTTFDAGTTGLTPVGATTGPVTLSGTLNVANGGTGVSSTPANGQLLIGNGTNYTVANVTTGAGLSTTTGSGTLQFNNTGVTSIAGTAGQVNASASTGAVTLSLAAKATLQTSTQNPTGTTSTTGVMMGLGATGSPSVITPSSTGNLLVNVAGNLVNSRATTSDTVQIRYGTGSAPTNGAALTGTVIGGAAVYTNGSTTTIKVPFHLSAVITGLSVSTPVWIDVSLMTSNSLGTATASNVTVCSVEV